MKVKVKKARKDELKKREAENNPKRKNRGRNKWIRTECA